MILIHLFKLLNLFMCYCLFAIYLNRPIISVISGILFFLELDSVVLYYSWFSHDNKWTNTILDILHDYDSRWKVTCHLWNDVSWIIHKWYMQEFDICSQELLSFSIFLNHLFLLYSSLMQERKNLDWCEN